MHGFVAAKTQRELAIATAQQVFALRTIDISVVIEMELGVDMIHQSGSPVEPGARICCNGPSASCFPLASEPACMKVNHLRSKAHVQQPMKTNSAYPRDGLVEAKRVLRGQHQGSMVAVHQTIKKNTSSRKYGAEREPEFERLMEC